MTILITDKHLNTAFDNDAYLNGVITNISSIANKYSYYGDITEFCFYSFSVQVIAMEYYTKLIKEFMGRTTSESTMDVLNSRLSIVENFRSKIEKSIIPYVPEEINKLVEETARINIVGIFKDVMDIRDNSSFVSRLDEFTQNIRTNDMSQFPRIGVSYGCEGIKLRTTGWETLPFWFSTVEPEVLTCFFTGSKIYKYLLYPIYGTDKYGRDGVSECILKDGVLYLPRDCVRAMNYDGTQTGRVPVPLVSQKKWVEKDGKYYTFNINECVRVYPNRFIFIKDLERSDNFIKVKDDLYVEKEQALNSRHLKVVDIFPSFLAEPYEQVCRGSIDPEENTLFMGMELEVERSKKATKSIRQIHTEIVKLLPEKVSCVGDGSLSDGLEIVSVPATLDTHYNIWRNFLRSDIRKQIVSFIRSSCGIHIHLSKESFSTLSLGKFIHFINKPENQEFIDFIAQRKANSYNNRSDTKITGISKDKNLVFDTNGNTNRHYDSVNVENEHTVEVRIFKGTLSYASVMKNFEFCHALHRYVTFVASNNQLTHSDFTNWLLGSQEIKLYYPYLSSLLDEKTKLVNITKEDLTDNQVERNVTENPLVVTSEVPEEKLVMLKIYNSKRKKKLI